MNWDALGAMGETFGAIAVVVTFFYLAKQIRQNSASLDRANDYAQAASVNDANSMYIQVFAPLAQNAELAHTYIRSLLNTDAGLNWWKTEGLHLYTREFVGVVERINASSE